eukprot:1239762-Lingulodinium_polyedra.AAC.1
MAAPPRPWAPAWALVWRLPASSAGPWLNLFVLLSGGELAALRAGPHGSVSRTMAPWPLAGLPARHGARAGASM